MFILYVFAFSHNVRSKLYINLMETFRKWVVLCVNDIFYSFRYYVRTKNGKFYMAIMGQKLGCSKLIIVNLR